MSKRGTAKGKICRRLGVNLWGRSKDPLARKNYAPGMHGNKRRKMSGYALQLAGKQKLKNYYGDITEKQFYRAYEEATRLRGDTAENLIGLLERRLDMVVYRLSFVPTIFAARQFVNHGHVTVNGKRTNVPSFQVNEGDLIEVRERARQIPMVLDCVQHPDRDVPEYLEADFKDLRGRFVRTPKLQDVPYPVQMEPNLVIEYYSR